MIFMIWIAATVVAITLQILTNALNYAYTRRRPGIYFPYS